MFSLCFSFDVVLCGKTMETGTITEWKVKEGEAFAAGDIICMVETDKVTHQYCNSSKNITNRISVQTISLWHVIQ